MINTKVTQTVQRTLKEACYDVQDLDNDCTIGSAREVLCRTRSNVDCILNDSVYRLVYNQSEGTLYYDVEDSNGNKIGFFTRAGVKRSFFKSGYSFVHASLYGQDYNVYEVGLGKNGVFFTCYKRSNDGTDDDQIGIIHKSALVKSREDEYLCFSSNEQCAKLLTLFSMYVDILEFRNDGIAATGVKEYQCTYICNSELKEKFNPEFLKQNNINLSY
jgi:hypothetical protein